MIKKLLFGVFFLLLFYQCRRQYGLVPIPISISTPVLVNYPVDTNIYCTTPIPILAPDPKEYYWQAFHELSAMLTDEQQVDFKRAVFVTENAYYQNRLSYKNFCDTITGLVTICKAWMKANPLTEYSYKDSSAIAKSRAAFGIMTDTMWLRLADGYKATIHDPYRYDFEDYFGKEDWTKMFVTKLLQSSEGNCHSLPFLFKIFCNELGTDAFLAFAPNHLYIKQRCEKYNWYNTELTSGVFPVDAWIMASGYISIDAIRNGMYMKALDEKQSIAVCLIDLAEGYKRKFGQLNDNFIMRCCNTALHYYPAFANAMLLKAETLKSNFDQFPNKNKLNPEERKTYEDMEQTYLDLANEGYREMPERMYKEWIATVDKEKEKYQNIKINQTYNAQLR